MEHRGGEGNDEPLERTCWRKREQMKHRDKRTATYKRELSTAISTYTLQSAIPIEQRPIGSFESWLTRDHRRLPIKSWQPHLEEEISQAWLNPGDLRPNGTGLLLANDLIAYAAASLPKRVKRECRKRLFGRAANRVAAVEILILGHALWRPDFPVYFNPYTAGGFPLDWEEILAAENMVRQKIMVL